VPYPPMDAAAIQKSAYEQATIITTDLKQSGAIVDSDREIVALIAYLQKLGKPEKNAKIAQIPSIETPQ